MIAASHAVREAGRESRVLLRVLGPLEVNGRDGTVPLGAAKPRALLAALAITLGRPRSADALIDAVWGEQPPSSAAKVLQVYVSQLRKVLPEGLRIDTAHGGYALVVDPAEVDATTFEHLLADGRAALGAGNPELAASVLRRGLALWRGPAFADVRYELFALAEAERLETLRDLAHEELLDAELRLGRHADVLGEARGLLAGDATRERVAELAMLAAYRAAGPSEALAIHDQVATALAAELGESPGPALVALRARIVARDPGLALDRGPDAPRPALPEPPNALIGRQRELAELKVLLARPGVRLVSLAGAGGSGKSRLALEIARGLAPDFANGAVLVELESLDDPARVPATIARACGLDPGPDAMATLLAGLAARELLLVLDNVEHLRAATPVLVRLLAGAPRVVILATTRVVLHLSGEHVYPVAPLADPDAVDLFATRARAHDPSFILDPASEPVVKAICRRLEGLPLAIELAAARLQVLGLRGLDARLASRLSVLAGGPRDLPARQQTLRETLDWSVRLLEPAEGRLLAAISVFAGGFILEAAAEVCVDRDDTLAVELLARLVQASLLVAEERPTGMRYRLLDTVREHAAERLEATGDRGAVRERHAAWFLALAERMEPLLTGDGQTSALATLETEHDNVRAALATGTGAGDDPTRFLRLAVAMSRFWYVRGYLAEGRSWLERALDEAGEVEPALRRRALTAAAAIALLQGDHGSAVSFSERSLEAARETGSERVIANGLSNLGAITLAAGDRDRARGLLEEAVALARRCGDERIAALAINNLGDLALTEGEYAAAEPLFEESLALLRARGDTANVARSLFNLGASALMLDRPVEARERFREGLALGVQADDREDLAWCLLGLAGAAAWLGAAEQAGLLLGAAVAVLHAMGADFKPFERHLHDLTADRSRAVAGEDAFERARRQGAEMPLDAAILLATAA